MRLLLPVAAVLAVLFSPGCDSLDQKQYVITRPSADDRAKVLQVVASTAHTVGLADKTESSVAYDTIAFYRGPGVEFPVNLDARTVDNLVVVNLSCFHPGPVKSPPYRSAETMLTQALTAEFKGRLLIPDYQHQLPLNRPFATVAVDARAARLKNRTINSLFSGTAGLLALHGFHERNRRDAGGYTVLGSRLYSDAFFQTNGIVCMVQMDRESVEIDFLLFKPKPTTQVLSREEQQAMVHSLAGDLEGSLRKQLPSSYPIKVTFCGS